MVLCLLALTDLQTRRAGLSASAELLVLLLSAVCAKLFIENPVVDVEVNKEFSQHT